MSDNHTSNNSFDKVNPSHYKRYSVEVFEMAKQIWGKEAMITHCEISSFYYRMRMGTKPNESIETDLAKEKWYLDKANELRNT